LEVTCHRTVYAPFGSLRSGTMALRPLSAVRVGPPVTTFPVELRTSIEFGKASTVWSNWSDTDRGAVASRAP
jgi:hypothetical protein